MKYEMRHHLRNKYSGIKSVMNNLLIDLYDLANDKIKIDRFKECLVTLNTENIIITFLNDKRKTMNGSASPISAKIILSLSVKEFIRKLIAEIDVSYFK